ncbi:hypothetical protein D3C71_775690 [compost metagenome]
MLEQVESVAVGQHQIQQHQLEVVLRQQGLPLSAGVRERELAMIGFEVFAQHLGQFDVVVDQQNAVRHR